MMHTGERMLIKANVCLCAVQVVSHLKPQFYSYIKQKTDFLTLCAGVFVWLQACA